MNSADFCDLLSFFKYEESGAFLCHLEGSCKMETVMVQVRGQLQEQSP